jgi:hypothetical protein
VAKKKGLEPGTIKRKGDFIAFKMADSVTAGSWYVIHPAHGGGYTSGEAERIEDPDGGWS